MARRVSIALLGRLRQEGGFTMAAVMGVMLGIMAFSAVAVAVATNDLEGNAYNRETKQAIAAAEAGLADYVYHLNQDNAYWARCTNVGTPNAVNQRGAVTRRRTVPGTNSDYAIELLPANGQAACSEASAAQTMIDTATGTFRIRSTGRVPTGNGRFAERQLVATLKRRSFLDFLYFTDFETSDPAMYDLVSGGRPTRAPRNPPGGVGQNIVAWASANCQTYWKDGRGAKLYDGEIQNSDGSWSAFQRNCGQIQFAGGDRINGPLHTNDDLYVCGSPVFGRSSQDKIEVSGKTDGTPGWRPSCSGANPNFVGTFNPSALRLTLPPSNTKLEQTVDPAYRFTGKTTINLTGSTMQVTNVARGLTNASMALPPNGVIFVEDGVCGVGYKPLTPYSTPEGCGDVLVKGAYSNDLTIAAEKDVVIMDDITRSTDVVLGLIANNFVRVYHDCASGANLGSVRIDAAILALQHSFTVDGYYCGGPLGTLTVNGVIAQKFRGPVGTGGSSVSTGYLKSYNYDDRLTLRQPPHFLDPVQSAWRVQRQSEQTVP